MNSKKARKIRKICKKMGKHPNEHSYNEPVAIFRKQIADGVPTKEASFPSIALVDSCGRKYYKALKDKLS